MFNEGNESPSKHLESESNRQHCRHFSKDIWVAVVPSEETNSQIGISPCQSGLKRRSTRSKKQGPKDTINRRRSNISTIVVGETLGRTESCWLTFTKRADTSTGKACWLSSGHILLRGSARLQDKPPCQELVSIQLWSLAKPLVVPIRSQVIHIIHQISILNLLLDLKMTCEKSDTHGGAALQLAHCYLALHHCCS